MMITTEQFTTGIPVSQPTILVRFNAWHFPLKTVNFCSIEYSDVWSGNGFIKFLGPVRKSGNRFSEGPK